MLDQLIAQVVEQVFGPWGVDSIDVNQVYQIIDTNYPDEQKDAARKQFDQMLQQFVMELVAGLSGSQLLQLLREQNTWQLFLGQAPNKYPNVDSQDEWIRHFVVDLIFQNE